MLHRKRTIVKTCNYANSLNKITIDIDFELCYNVITMNETKPERRKKMEYETLAKLIHRLAGALKSNSITWEEFDKNLLTYLEEYLK